MRMFFLVGLVAASFSLGTVSAHEVGVFLTSDYSGRLSERSDTVTVHLDMEGGDPGIQFLSAGVRFDSTVLACSQAPSTTSTYLPYSDCSGRYRTPATWRRGDSKPLLRPARDTASHSISRIRRALGPQRGREGFPIALGLR